MSLSRMEIMLKLERLIKENGAHPWIMDNILFMHVGGSRLYGINREDSDYDIRGVVLAPRKYWVGAHKFEQLEIKSEKDGLDFVLYDFRKWLKLTVDTNPNVIETLYVDPEGPNSISRHSDIWPLIQREVKPLISQRAYAGYHGYSTSQLKKMAVKQGNKTGRQEIVQEHGFDLKFASHGFRLIYQGAELLTTGNITFPRPEADFLKAIRQGKIFGPDQIQRCIDTWELEQEILKKALDNSILPKKADFDSYSYLQEYVFNHFVLT